MRRNIRSIYPKFEIIQNIREISDTIQGQAKVFWVVTPCSDVVGHQTFGGPRYSPLQGEVK